MIRRSKKLEPVVDTTNAELTASLGQLRTALDALPMGMIIVDRFGREFWRNSASQIVLSSEFESRKIESELKNMATNALRGVPMVNQISISGPPQRILEVRTVSLEDGGVLVTLEDTTESFLTDRVRTDFVANISHELKTPVGALSILAETIEGEIVEDTDDVLKSLAHRMVDESYRVNRIIDDLLELASIEFDAEVSKSTVSVRGLVDESIARSNPFAAQKGITISTTVSEEISPVAGDARLLASAVSNLVENAVKYSERGDMVQITAVERDDQVEIQVSDEGIGISPEHMERVFERFYRVDKARSRDTGGTGLGLAIVSHIVANHGGKVTVRSTEGEGTTFSLTLPMFRG